MVYCATGAELELCHLHSKGSTYSVGVTDTCLPCNQTMCTCTPEVFKIHGSTPHHLPEENNTSLKDKPKSKFSDMSEVKEQSVC